MMRPEWIMNRAGSWFGCVVNMDLITAMSSTCFARCGMISETHVPDWPCCANLKGLRSKPPAPRVHTSGSGGTEVPRRLKPAPHSKFDIDIETPQSMNKNAAEFNIV